MADIHQQAPLIVHIYQKALACFPSAYRQEFSDELLFAIRMAAEDAKVQGRLPSLRLAWRELRDLPLAAVRAHIRERTVKMGNLSTGNYSIAKTSFHLALANVLFTILMFAILYTGLAAVSFTALPLPVQLGLTILLFAVPTVLSIASLVTGLKSVRRSHRAGQKVSWMAAAGTLLGGMGTVNLAFIYLAIIMETYGS